MLNTPELTFAQQAVRQASQVVRQVQEEMISAALTKDDRSPVTVGDFAAQAVVARLLRETFPQDALVGEESADALRQPDGEETRAQVTGFVRRQCEDATDESVCEWIDLGAAEAQGRFWTLDPIDGTKGFLRGDQYAIALALIEDGVVQLGVLGCPNLNTSAQPDVGGAGSLYMAVRGQGAWVASLNDAGGNFIPLHVSDRTDPRQGRMLRSVEAGHTHGGKIDDLASVLEVAAEPVRMDSQAKYAVLAAGRGDLILRLLSPSRPDYREKIWDQAAGSIVVEEAGGRVSDLDGKALDFSQGRTLAKNRGVLVSNSHLHDAVLAGLVQVGA